jgi:hypothetical protein
MYVQESVSMTTTRRQDQPQQANEERQEEREPKTEEREKREEQRLGRERVEKLEGAAEI